MSHTTTTGGLGDIADNNLDDLSPSGSNLEPDFVVGETVLVYFYQVLYKAEVMKVSKYLDSPDDHPLWRYYVHYENTHPYRKTDPKTGEICDKWDEWVTTMRIVEGNLRRILHEQASAFRQLSSPLKPKIHRPPAERHDDKNKVNGMWIDHIHQEKKEIDTRLGTPLPPLLYIRMIEDRELCLHAGMIIRLPHPCTINNIVELFTSYLREKERSRLVEKLVSIWVDHFDLKVSKYLFDSEEKAYKVASFLPTGKVTPSEIYGVEHLIRMLVALPKSLYAYGGISKEDAVQTLADFFAFIQDNERTFYHVRADEDD